MDWYALSGDVAVKNNDEVKELIDRYSKINSELQLQIIDENDDQIELEFSGGCFANDAEIENCNKIVNELGKFAITPGELVEEYENDRNEIYFGPEKCKAQFLSQVTLEEMKEKLPMLLPEEKAILKSLL